MKIVFVKNIMKIAKKKCIFADEFVKIRILS